MTYLASMSTTGLHAPIVRADAHTAFVLGNGPSLRGVDLAALSDYATIGLNAAYRYWRRIGWRPTYYACLDLTVGLSHKAEIAALIEEGRIEKFLLRQNLIEALGDAAHTRRVVNFDALRARLELLQEPAITTGSHAALWIATLGFKKIVLLGVDGRYKEVVDGAERRNGIELEVVRAGENPNYFFDGYQQPGDRYNIPNPRPGLHVGAWRAAALLLRKAGVEAYNANADSAVRCFPFVDLQSLLGPGATPSPADEPLPAARAPVPAQSEAVTPPSPMNAARKLLGFLRTNLFACLTPGAILAIGLVALLAEPGAFSRGFAAAYVLLSGLIWSLFILLLYTRRATIAQLNLMRHEIEALKAAADDMTRIAADEGALAAGPIQADGVENSSRRV
ncbi:hypothetical protein [Amphiplicatus metriothermophilus]|uniref:Uncharacterized protein n=1 Tax=Amphiplicatus metriothermophilus TaxID=1519374 RepID=A0A239Q0Z1_9PROT|nr:hypothetical protein [Amphiplicatus metriothermophilus]MBB5520088.1 hypothetical protein [Amphiplicatus metriothermophilus]SNT75896.1 hypothetical protein SAMN06297382_2959 [Amphiplicatus metriothermophilus]